MFRSIAKWYISRAIDSDRDLPAWVKRQVARDSVLKQFYDQSRQLAARLRTAEFAKEGPVHEEFNVANDAPNRAATERPQPAAVRLAIFAIGLAAIFLLALAPYFNRSPQDGSVISPAMAKTDSEPNSRAGSAVDPVDALRLRELIASGRTLVQSLNQRSASGPAQAIEQAIEYEPFTGLVDLEIKQVLQPVSDFGSSYGVLLSQFDHHVETENRRIIADGIGAWQFFVHKLPQSAASLAGL